MTKITAGEKEERSKITLKGKHCQQLSIQCGKEALETKKAWLNQQQMSLHSSHS